MLLFLGIFRIELLLSLTHFKSENGAIVLSASEIRKFASDTATVFLRFQCERNNVNVTVSKTMTVMKPNFV